MPAIGSVNVRVTATTVDFRSGMQRAASVVVDFASSVASGVNSLRSNLSAASKAVATFSTGFATRMKPIGAALYEIGSIAKTALTPAVKAIRNSPLAQAMTEVFTLVGADLKSRLLSWTPVAGKAVARMQGAIMKGLNSAARLVTHNPIVGAIAESFSLIAGDIQARLVPVGVAIARFGAAIRVKLQPGIDAFMRFTAPLRAFGAEMARVAGPLKLIGNILGKELSSAIRGASSLFGKTLSGAATKAVAALRPLTTVAIAVGSALTKMGLGATIASLAAMRGVTVRLTTVFASLGRMANKGFGPIAGAVSSIGSRMAGLLTRFGPLAAGMAAVGAAAAGISGAVNFEQAEIAFGVLFKSVDTAKTVIGDLSKFAAETPFELPELTQAARSLAAFGISAKNVVPELRMIGDISAGIGAPITEIATLYGKAKVQGRLFAKDINELTGRGIPVIGALAKQFGVSEKEIGGLVTAGKVGFPEIQKAFQSMTGAGGQFEKLMEKQSQSLGGIWSTLKDNVGLTLTEIAGTLLQAFDVKGTMAKLITFTGSVKASIKSITPILVQFATTASALWNLVSITAMSVFSSISEMTGITMGSTKDFIVDTLIAGEFLFNNFGSVVALVWEKIKLGAVTLFNDIGHFFTAVIPAWLTWFSTNWSDVLFSAFDLAATVFINLGKNLRSIFSAFWKWLKSGFKGAFEINWTPLTEGAVSAIKSMPDIPKRAVTELEKQLSLNVAAMGDSLGTKLGEHMVKRREEILAATTPAAGPIKPATEITPIAELPDAKSKISAADGSAALHSSSSDALSAIFKSMRETTQDKILKNSESQLSETKQMRKDLDKMTKADSVQINVGTVA